MKDQLKLYREPAPKPNERKIPEEKYARVKAEFEKKNKELKHATHNLGKISDYVLSRPLLPDSIRKNEGENKIKLVMDAIQFMNRTL